ncbi:DUF4129 domain-containing protein [Candidatus Albibeggiatoa sp. nov. BB20]|uniref:DUF4129 domain-containing protein n=1 Tax=Candidatus Albibeggiatoa sp. nov. BB20 TaxID=3162723 RepID=UPI0033654F85
MQLDKIEAVVRPRTPWEAIDLGFCMVQHWMWDFYRIWFVLTFPLFLAVYILAYLFTEMPDIWAAIIVWWLRPLYNRIVLHFFSHALFGEQITLRQMIQALPRLLLKTSLLLGLTLYRLSTVRSFTLPIWQLEGNRGAVARQRFQVLQQNTRSTAMWLTVICAHFQGLIVLLLYVLVFLFLPQNTDLESTFLSFTEDSPIFLWINLVFNYIALSLIEPFYVAGGFSLYLNRRTHLEGWDIELTFRQIRKKVEALQTTAMICLVAVTLSCFSFYASPVSAQSIAKPEQSKQYIEQVLQQSEFETVEKQQYWKYIGDSLASEDSEATEGWQLPLSWISLWAQLFEVLLWITIAGVIGWIIYKTLQNPALQQWLNQKQSNIYQPQVTFSLIPKPENDSLPDNIAQQTWELWEQGEHRQAVSLLYRGTLLQLQQQYEMAIYDSATENECVRLVRRTQGVDLSTYFSRLTRAWQILAYGKHLPDSNEIQQLCEQWTQHFQ